MHRNVFAILAVLSLATGASAAGADWRADCRSSYDPDFGECIVHRTGAQSAETIRARGAELIRVLVFKPDRVDAPILLADIVQPENGEDELILHDALDKDAARTYAFGRGNFEALRRQLMAMQGYGAVLHGAKPVRDFARGGHGNVERICLHGASGWVQVALAGAPVRAAELNYCETVDYNFVNKVLDLAQSADPICGKLSDYQMWAPEELQACVHLTGNRVLAAEAYRLAAQTARWKQNRKPPSADAIERLVAPGMRLRLDGTTAAIGRTVAIGKWLNWGSSRWDYMYRLTRASAESGTIIVRGIIHRYNRESYDGESRAPSTQVWRVDGTGHPRLTEWDIGAFEPYRLQ